MRIVIPQLSNSGTVLASSLARVGEPRGAGISALGAGGSAVARSSACDEDCHSAVKQ